MSDEATTGGRGGDVSFLPGRGGKPEGMPRGMNGDIVFKDAEGVDWIRLRDVGFFVRGVKLEQDASEARAVFDEMRHWLASAFGVLEKPTGDGGEASVTPSDNE